MRGYLTRDRVAVLAALVAPLVLAAVLVPFRDSFPNTDAALAMLLVVVAVAANGYRLAGILAALSAAVWSGFFLTQPYKRFTITRRTDIETTVLLLILGELLVESGGIFRGRFLMTPFLGVHPAPEQRLLAVAFAGQAGAVLGTGHPVEQA